MKFKKKITGIFTGTICLTAVSATCPAQEKQQPNIIFMLADDMRYDELSYIGKPVLKTPNLDYLAENGTWFNNSYVTTSICVVSRVSIMTGMYARRHGIYEFYEPINDTLWQQTYPMLLQKNGYKTGYIGKFGIADFMWTREVLPLHDFDSWFGAYIGQGDYETYDHNGHPIHLTRRNGDQAVRFIRNHRDEPFCLAIGFKTPHLPLIPDPVYHNHFKEGEIPLPETYGDAYHKKLPPCFDGSTYGYKNFKKRISTPETFDAWMRERYRMIYGMDMTIGEIIHELESLGIDDNTIIIFISDNGFYLGEHGLFGKWWGHKESVRVPIIVYDPRLPENKKGQKLDQIALNIDIMPTILQYAGLEIPQSVQGKSLVPLIQGQNPEWRTDFYYEQHYERRSKDGQGWIMPVEGVVSTRYKYMNYFLSGDEELFDLNNDPNEVTNLAEKQEYEKLLKQMKEKYISYKEALK